MRMPDAAAPSARSRGGGDALASVAAVGGAETASAEDVLAVLREKARSSC